MRQCPEVILNKIFINVFAHWSATVVICCTARSKKQEGGGGAEEDKTSSANCRQTCEMTTKALIPFAGLLNRRLLGELAATFEETLAALKSYVQKLNWNKCELGEGTKEVRGQRGVQRERERVRKSVALFEAYFLEKTIRKEFYIPFSFIKSFSSIVAIHNFVIY